MNSLKHLPSLSVVLLVLLGTGSSVFSQTISEEAQRHFSRGIAAAEMAHSTAGYEDAIREFEKAKALAPNWPDVFYNLGLLLERTGDYDGAIQNFQKYLRLAPASADADQVRETIHKLEYKREWSNIEGIWRVDKSGLWDNIACDPEGYMVVIGGMLGSKAVVEDIHLEIRKAAKGFEARVLNSKSRYGHLLPDGPYVSVGRDGEMVTIYDATIYTCDKKVDSRSCPWNADFILTQVSADTLEGTIKMSGYAYQIVFQTGRRGHAVGLACDGKIVLRRTGGAQ